MFAYGTLLVPEIIARVIGRVPASSTAELPGYRRVRVQGEVFPAVFAAADSRVPGRCYRGLEAREVLMLDRYEGDLYQRIRVEVLVHGRIEQADCYVLRPGYEHVLSQEAWDLASFTRLHASTYTWDP